jgi:hypothetical protein
MRFSSTWQMILTIADNIFSLYRWLGIVKLPSIKVVLVQLALDMVEKLLYGVELRCILCREEYVDFVLAASIPNECSAVDASIVHKQYNVLLLGAFLRSEMLESISQEHVEV